MYQFRVIQKNDNLELARIIRASLKEKGVDRPGTVYTDPTTDNLFDLFKHPKSFYLIVENNGEILGGCGLFPTKGLASNYCELVKLYIKPEVKGQGLGKVLINKCFSKAKELGFEYVYLETLNELKSAVSLYEDLGFKRLSSPLGDSGHNACDIWMLKPLSV